MRVRDRAKFKLRERLNLSIFFPGDDKDVYFSRIIVGINMYRCVYLDNINVRSCIKLKYISCTEIYICMIKKSTVKKLN